MGRTTVLSTLKLNDHVAGVARCGLRPQRIRGRLSATVDSPTHGGVVEREAPIAVAGVSSHEEVCGQAFHGEHVGACTGGDLSLSGSEKRSFKYSARVIDLIRHKIDLWYRWKAKKCPDQFGFYRSWVQSQDHFGPFFFVFLDQSTNHSRTA